MAPPSFGQQSLGEYLRHGQTPFFRLPLSDLRESGPAAHAGADAVLLGVPFDGGTTYQPGARLGPYHVRRCSALVQPFHATHRIDVFEALKVLDGGNVPAPPFNPALVRELVQGEVRSIVDAGAIPFVVGGDHSIALPVLRALAERHGPVALVHIDAHYDTSSSESWAEPFHHGTPIRNAMDEELVAPGLVFQIGMRGSWKDADEQAASNAHRATMVTADELGLRGVEALGDRIRDTIGNHPCYVSFDIDAVDPAFAPGTGTAVPGGLTSREALGLLRALRGLTICGMDLVEIAPGLDHADMTSLLGATLLFEGLALAALAKANRSIKTAESRS